MYSPSVWTTKEAYTQGRGEGGEAIHRREGFTYM